MRKKNPLCKTCGNCKRFYVVYGFKPARTHIVYCTVKGEPTESASSCERWCKKEVLYDLSSERFDEAAENIKFLMRLFQNK